MARREQSSVALLVFQLDSFPGCRDVFGRHSADACLRKVAHSITGSMRRAGDLTARLSDDQFVDATGRTVPEFNQVVVKHRGKQFTRAAGEIIGQCLSLFEAAEHTRIHDGLE